jgi:hypothetical protein
MSYNHSTEEVFWEAMTALYYAAEASHVMEQYWDCSGNHDEHPTLSTESQYTQQKMCSFSVGLGKFTCGPEFHPSVDASKRAQDRAEDAAFSRLRPIQEGQDYWRVISEEHRSSADTGLSGSGPGRMPAMFEFIWVELHTASLNLRHI